MKLIIWIRSFLGTLLYPFLVIFFTILIVLSGLKKSWRPIQDQIICGWARWSLKLFGVKTQVQGLENIPKVGYIAVFNHTSNFDILAVQSLIPQVRFGAKIELFKIPIFGLAMRAAGALQIARADREKVLKVYDEAKLRIQSGESFILAPEGTRQTTEKLGSFKSGPFLFAISAQAPILPIAIKGATLIQSKKSWFPNTNNLQSTIYVSIGKPISTEGMTLDSKEELQSKVRESFFQLGLV